MHKVECAVFYGHVLDWLLNSDAQSTEFPFENVPSAQQSAGVFWLFCRRQCVSVSVPAHEIDILVCLIAYCFAVI